MNGFDQLHPALRHHIVNSLGWNQLRPTQAAAIDPILNDRHVLILAPTAGGKTEAAVFPVFSRMLTQRWTGLSALYICPLRALLNNLEPRLGGYARLVGRSVGIWHGDVSEGLKRGLLREPPDLLLTTPESLEGMLISRRVDRVALLANLRSVIVDELHAFAGDDRGWHLLAILERIGRIAGRRVQRLGLSATIGNPEALLSWLGCGEAGDIIGQPAPPAGGDVTIDHVGSLENAAIVLSRLYRGEKRLVFCDSRARVEALAAQLHERGVETFVSHSSLAAAERRRAEDAFASAAGCVIVATSTLELGIDVGDLDRVVQIDAPRTVSAFLQRMGRTGRRFGAARNCLLLATSDEAFLETLGIARLWEEGFVEPINPPPLPLHLLAQQIMALILQQGGLGRREWREWVGHAFRGVPEKEAAETIGYMLASGILSIDNGILGLGPRGEAVFGGRNFLELVSAFTTPLLLTVRHGASELGQVDPTTLRGIDDALPNLLLAGRSWKVTSVDWRRRTAYVEPAPEMGRSRWFGGTGGLHFDLAQGIERAIVARSVAAKLSRRAGQRFAEVVEQFRYCDGRSIPLVRDRSGRLRWWSFAGTATNQMLATALQSRGITVFTSDDLGITTAPMPQHDAITTLERIAPANISVPIHRRAIRELKFVECLQDPVAERVLRGRLFPTKPLAQLLAKPLRLIVSPEA